MERARFAAGAPTAPEALTSKDRFDPRVAEEILHSLFAGTAEAALRACLAFLADSIQYIAAHANDRWTVTLDPDCVRFHVGRAELIILHSDGIWVLVDHDPGLSGATLLKKRHPMADGSQQLSVPYAAAEAVLPVVRQPHETAILLAAKRPSRRGLIGAHSPGLVACAWKLLRLNSPIPAPAKLALPAALPSPAPQYWWVNHRQIHRQELEGEYLWSPQRNRNGSHNESSTNMTRVQPGDMIFSCADAAVWAVGVALGRAREAPKPEQFAVAGDQREGDAGWQVPVRFIELEKPLRPSEHAIALVPVLPQRHSPIRVTGTVNQHVHLAAIPEAMAIVLRRMLEGQLEDLEHKIEEIAGPDLPDEVAEDVIRQRTDIGPVDKQQLIRARRGQGAFRRNLEQIESTCRLTGLLDRRHLRASHIKPWRVSDDREKLDGFNGLLLSPHIDHLFGRGYISLSDEGELLVSRYLDPSVLAAWRLVPPVKLGAFRPQQRVYIEYHRREVFERHDSGSSFWGDAGYEEAGGEWLTVGSNATNSTGKAPIP
jgi:putative restriction endonuclease